MGDRGDRYTLIKLEFIFGGFLKFSYLLELSLFTVKYISVCLKCVSVCVVSQTAMEVIEKDFALLRESSSQHKKRCVEMLHNLLKDLGEMSHLVGADFKATYYNKLFR